MSAAHPRVVLLTFGTHGDLNPFIALGVELRRQGVRSVVATSETYRAKVEAEGLEFAHLRPELETVAARLGMNERAMVRRVARSPEFLLTDILLPHLRETYEDSLAALQGADLAVLHSTAYAGKVAAERLGIPHFGVALQPMMLFSAFDPPLIGNLPRLSAWVHRRGRWATRRFLSLGRWLSMRWARPIGELRREVGLPTNGAHPLFDSFFADLGVLALYSPSFGPPQPDHPPRTFIVGFPFYDSETGHDSTLDAELRRFLDSGAPPLVFTQGTSAIQDADLFIRESAAAVQRLGARAVFVLDAQRAARWRPEIEDPDVLITGYAPYSQLFPRARINVHHGGVGTTAQALRAGRPQLITPYLVDQPDNAARAVRLGVARSLGQEHYRAARVARELGQLAGAAYEKRAREVGQLVAAEEGAAAASGLIVDALARLRDRQSTKF